MQRRTFIAGAAAVGAGAVTLTYLGPTIGAGDLIVPAASEAELAPLLAEALVLLRASQFAGDDGDDWVNEGTLGAVGDGSPQTAVGDAGAQVGPPMYVDRSMFTQDLVLATNVINEGDGDPSLASTPDAAAVSLTGDHTLRCRGRMTPGWANHGGAQGVLVRKAFDGDALGSVYSINLIPNGGIRVTWREADDTDITEDMAPGAITDLELFDVAIQFDVDNGAGGYEIRAYKADDAASDLVLGGQNFDLIATVTGGSTTDIKDTTGFVTVGVGKGWFELGEIYSGAGATPTLVASFDAEDAAGEGDSSWVSSATGETWSVTGIAAVIDTTAPGFVFGGLQTNVNGWEIPDHNDLDFGTGDGTIVIKARVFEVADTNGETFVWAQKATGQIGVDFLGWQFLDIKFDPFIDALLMAAGDGTDYVAAAANTHTAGSNLAALTLDRDGNAAGYLNAAAFGSPASMAAVGTITNAADVIIGGTNNLVGVVEAFALYDRVLTSDEVAELSSLLA